MNRMLLLVLSTLVVAMLALGSASAFAQPQICVPDDPDCVPFPTPDPRPRPRSDDAPAPRPPLRHRAERRHRHGHVRSDGPDELRRRRRRLGPRLYRPRHLRRGRQLHVLRPAGDARRERIPAPGLHRSVLRVHEQRGRHDGVHRRGPVRRRRGGLPAGDEPELARPRGVGEHHGADQAVDHRPAKVGPAVHHFAGEARRTTPL